MDIPVEIAAQPTEALPVSQQDAVAAALAMALAEGGEPFAPTEPGPGTDIAAMDLMDPAALVKPVRPKARPAAPVTAPIEDGAGDVQDLAAVAPVDTVATVEMDASSIVAGTRLVQLGAFDDADAARGEWATLQDRFAELIAGKAMVVQAAQSGGRTFYRLRAHGFEGEDEARRFCAALLAENASCIPVSQR